jgi:hypothetical protein
MVNILGANSVSGGYEIDNSLRFNDNDSPRLTFTPSSAGNRKTFTLSVWFKLQAGTTGERVILAADDGGADNGNFDYIDINPADLINLYNYSGSENYVFNTTQVLRDPSAWYHLVVAFDTTQSTDTNRVKIYLNGSQITSFATANYPSQNYETRYNNNNVLRIGSYPDQDVSYFDGYMAEYHFIDGTQKAPSDFGEFDDNGVWIPKAYDGSYGTNGFYLEFKETGTSQNSSGIGADTSGNDNHWAVTNLAATDVTTDTPTNNFATMSPLASADGQTFSEGNTQVVLATGSTEWCVSTMAVANGKWYCELKPTSTTGMSLLAVISETDSTKLTQDGLFEVSDSVGMHLGNGNKYIDGSASSYGTTLSDNDILGIAVNLDDDEVYFYKNGTVMNSGTAISKTFTAGKFYYIGAGSGTGSGGHTMQWNFGNAPYAISSGNADANGYGNFEYAVPSGYYSLCTKNLGEFG